MVKGRRGGGTENLDKRISASSPRLSRVSATIAALEFEKQVGLDGFRFIAGIDEVGRGCLAGAVVAAAVILDLEKPLPKGLNDSKKLTENQRTRIAAEIKETAVAFSIAQIEAEEIDRINILQATKLAMIHAAEQLVPAADFLLVDAVNLNNCRLPQKSIIGGDAVCASIAAASVLAKVYRDTMMRELDAVYPEYGFARHVGYGTKQHFEALRKHGATIIHRKSFRGVLS
jgi:ribonuclease HII